MRAQSINVFCCYAHEDEGLLRDLMIHLQPLQRQGLVNLWADIHINAGDEWKIEIDRHLNTAQIILLLVSPDFMNSDYCYSEEMRQAMSRHALGVVRVVPIILRPVFWQAAPFGKLQVLPPQARPIVHPDWHSRDEAFLFIVDGIRQIAETFGVAVGTAPISDSPQTFISPTVTSIPPLQDTLPQQGGIVQRPAGYVTFSTSSRQASSFVIPDTMINEQVVLQQVEQGNIPPEWNVFRPGKISTRSVIIPLIVCVITTLLCLSFFLNPGTGILLVIPLLIAFCTFLVLIFTLTDPDASYKHKGDVLILLPQGFVYKYTPYVYIVHFAQIEHIDSRDKPERTLVLEFRKNASLPAKDEFQFSTLEDRRRIQDAVVSAYYRYKSFNSQPQ